MALGLGVRAAATALVCLACSAAPPVIAMATSDQEKPENAELSGRPAAPAWPARDELFLVKVGTRLELRAASGFAHLLAESVQIALHDPALELVWLSDGQTLSVIDLRAPALQSVVPVVIARALPPHVELHVARGEHRVGLNDACDVAPVLMLRWTSEPWIESDDGEGLTRLEGRSWLAREIERPVRGTAAERWFHPSDARVELPPERTRCEDTEWCGTSQTLGASGLLLVLTEQSQGADCWHFGCVLFNPQNGTFATSPEPERWGSAADTPSGSCGPYRFDATGRWLLVDELLCAVGDGCEPLGGFGIGWLTPGTTVGAPG